MSHMHAANPAAARRLAAQIAERARNEKRAEYAAYRAEARACGYDPESFEEWLGEEDPKAKASERMANIPWSDLDLY